MTPLAPRFADEKFAAALLSMKPNEFLALVDAGHFPRGREIAPGYVRWDVEDLYRIARGDAAQGMGDISW